MAETELGFFQKLAYKIIRPPRDIYLNRNLGDPEFIYDGKKYLREDFQVLNFRGNRLQCSFIRKAIYNNIYSQKYTQQKSHTQALKQIQNSRPVIIYLHGNSGSRMKGLSFNNTITFLQWFDICLFDFSGSGISDGLFITLGYHEKQDLKQVIKYLREKKFINHIYLWGFSMGATVGIMYGGKYGSTPGLHVEGIVADSAFSDFSKVFDQTANHLLWLPQFATNWASKKVGEIIKERIKQTYGFEFLIQKLKPIIQMEKIKPKISVYLLSSKKDTVVKNSHSQQLYGICRSYKKKHIQIDRNHNDDRPQNIIQQVLRELKEMDNILRKKQRQKLVNEQNIRIKRMNEFQEIKVNNLKMRGNQMNNGRYEFQRMIYGEGVRDHGYNMSKNIFQQARKKKQEQTNKLKTQSNNQQNNKQKNIIQNPYQLYTEPQTPTKQKIFLISKHKRIFNQPNITRNRRTASQLPQYKYSKLNHI